MPPLNNHYQRGIGRSINHDSTTTLSPQTKSATSRHTTNYNQHYQRGLGRGRLANHHLKSSSRSRVEQTSSDLKITGDTHTLASEAARAHDLDQLQTKTTRTTTQQPQLTNPNPHSKRGQKSTIKNSQKHQDLNSYLVESIAFIDNYSKVERGAVEAMRQITFAQCDIRKNQAIALQVIAAENRLTRQRVTFEAEIDAGIRNDLYIEQFYLMDERAAHERVLIERGDMQFMGEGVFLRVQIQRRRRMRT